MDQTVESTIEGYQEGTISLGRAAELADVSVWEFIDALDDHGVELNYDESDLETDIRAVRTDDDLTP